MNKNIITEELYQKLQSSLKKAYFNSAKKIIEDFCQVYVKSDSKINVPDSNQNALELFLKAKRIEGSSELTLKYYKAILNQVFNGIDKNYKLILTNDLRNYLSNYKTGNSVSNVTVDNVRRVISSFFCWLECEDYIYKSPMKRIHKVKIMKKVKEVYDKETIETLKKGVKNI